MVINKIITNNTAPFVCALYNNIKSVTASKMDDVFAIIPNDNLINLTIHLIKIELHFLLCLALFFFFFLQHGLQQIAEYLISFRLNFNLNDNG